MGGGDEEAVPLLNKPETAKPHFDVLGTLKETWYLGFVAFGGPQAHIGLLRQMFVHHDGGEERWMDADTFTELLALCQALPGPTSTQLVCALAMFRGGWLAGVLSFVCWNLPAALLVTLVGSHIQDWLHGTTPPWLAGAKSAASALVFLAAWGFIKGNCFTKDGKGYNRVGCTLVAVSAAAVLLCNDADVQQAHPYITMWVYPLLLILGSLTTYWTFDRTSVSVTQAQEDADRRISAMGVPVAVGGVICAFTLVVLILCFVLVPSPEGLRDCDAHCRGWNIFNAFWRMGATIYGGGQVVIPMTLSYVVDPLWVTVDQFYQGLALIGMMPGPMFNFAAYIGAVYGAADPDGSTTGSWYCTVMAWMGLFGPGLLLIFGIVPFWAKARGSPTFRALLPGLSAAAIGLVVGSCVLLFEQTVQNPAGAITFALTICACTFVPPDNLGSLSNYVGPLAIVVGALAGAVLNLTHVGTALYASQYVCKGTGQVTLPSGASGEYHYCPN